MKKLLGHSWKTTLPGYVLAALIAAWDYIPDEAEPWVKIAMAVAIAVLGKQAADSRQVKEVDAKVESHIEETEPKAKRITKRN